ncbi:MAG: cellulase family glycosylhydrolase [Verrucomicrobia bacterium]|nr:cellulase family glycosylhydrolase [Verrucomicrobiota bacterium]
MMTTLSAPLALALACFTGTPGNQPPPAAAAPRAAEVATPAGVVQAGAIVLRTAFDSPAERSAWSSPPQARWVSGEGDRGMALRVEVPPAQASRTVMARRPLDLVPYRGMQLQFVCRAKAQKVSRPPEPHHGVKFMLHFTSPSLGARWHHPSRIHGTFDWKTLSFIASIPDDAAQGELDLGLQNATGTVWFDDITVVVARGVPPRRPAPMANPPPAFKGHNLPRLRGVMSPNAFKDEDLRVLGREWRANLIRWQITRNWGKPNTDLDLAEYDRWIDSELADLDQALAACSRYGLKAVVDLHSPPGGRYEDNSIRMFHEAPYQEHFIRLWEKIARRYRGHAAIWGYDLVNEPVQGKPSPPGIADWLGTQIQAARAIRAVDPDTTIIIEAEDWDSPPGFRYLTPVELPRIVYQVHMYWPHSYTHQGVHGGQTGVRYPGQIDGQRCDQAALQRYLQPVRDFQLAYNLHIYCGEFSAIRWAPGAAAYLKDCIELFEAYGWDWSYHAYREWDGWSVEHGSDPNDHRPAAMPTDRKTQPSHRIWQKKGWRLDENLPHGR